MEYSLRACFFVANFSDAFRQILLVDGTARLNASYYAEGICTFIASSSAPGNYGKQVILAETETRL
jgi:hypothetical protein